MLLDDWYPCVRIGKHRERVPILVVLGVRGTGERILVDLRLVGQETAAAWGEAVTGLLARGLRPPVLAVIDGDPGLRTALGAQWPEIAIGRCAVHKLRNLLAKTPARLREELAEDYRRMMYGETREVVERARSTLVKKWRLRCPPVMASLEEAGDDRRRRGLSGRITTHTRPKCSTYSRCKPRRADIHWCWCRPEAWVRSRCSARRPRP